MGISLGVWGRGGGGGGKVLGEGGEKAEILDFFVELGGRIVGRWRGRDDIFIDIGHLSQLYVKCACAEGRVWGGSRLFPHKIY